MFRSLLGFYVSEPKRLSPEPILLGKADSSDLLQTMVKHKSRLEKEKEAAMASNIFSRASKGSDTATPASSDSVRISIVPELKMPILS